MPTSACLLAGSLCIAALFLAGCQHEIGGATAAPVKSSGSGGHRPKKPEAKDKAKAKTSQPKPEVTPAKTPDAPASVARQEEKPKVAAAGKTDLPAEANASGTPDKPATTPSTPREADVTETGSGKSARPKKTPPNSPALKLTDGSGRTADQARGQASLSGINPDGRTEARPAPRVLSVKPDVASSARGTTAPAPVKTGEILSARTTSGDAAQRPTNLSMTDGKPDARSATGAPVALPAPAEEKSGSVERIAKPLNLTAWLADEKAHAEWLRRQQERQAAANAARESERLRLKRARDRMILDENPDSPEKTPVRE